MVREPWHQLVHLAEQCSVRIESRDGRFLGSGFFVARGMVLTCAHVVHRESAKGLRVRSAAATPMPVQGSVLTPDRHGGGRTYALPDLALLTVDASHGHPAVWLSQTTPPAWTRAVATGYSRHTPADGVAADTVTFEVVGTAAPPLLKVKEGRIPAGMSGSPVLDIDSGGVCGIVKAATDKLEPAEGWILPAEHILAAFPQLAAANAEMHPRGTAWWDLATRRTELTRRLFGSAEPVQTPPAPADPPPSWWLDPRNQVVDFYPRPELTDLIAWATDRHSSSPMIRLLCGPGGVGKTRLALELASHFHALGWVAGVRQPPEAEAAERVTDILEEAVRLGHRVLLVLDYVEGYRAEVERLATRVSPDSVRILLLARSAGAWWNSFAPEGAARYGVDRKPVVLGPPEEPPDGADGPFTAALRVFRRRLSEGADQPVPPALAVRASRYNDMLNLHAFALVSALHERDEGVLPDDAVFWRDPLDELVRHEGRHLMRSGRRLRLDHDPRLAAQLLLVPSLFAARNAVQAREVVGRLPSIAAYQAAATADLLRDLYPGPTALRWWAALPLDRLGETLVTQVVEDAGDGPGYLRTIFDSAAMWQAVEGLVLLVRVGTDERVPQPSREPITAALDTIVRSRRFLLLPALRVAETRVKGESPWTDRYVAELDGEAALVLVDAVRRSGRHSLREFALALLDRVEQLARQAPSNASLLKQMRGVRRRESLPPMLVVVRAMVLVELERFAEALRLTGELIQELRPDVAFHAEQDVHPQTAVIRVGFDGDRLVARESLGEPSEALAMALQVHAHALEGDERADEALDVSLEACAVARRAAAWDPDVELRLIHYLVEFAERLLDRGDETRAEPLLVEAVDRARRRPNDAPTTPFILLARLLDRQGRHAEAADLRPPRTDRAEPADPDPETAAILEAFSAWRTWNDLVERGHVDQARAILGTVIARLRDLAGDDPQTYATALALALVRAAATELPYEGAELSAEAVQVLRNLAGPAGPAEVHVLALADLQLAENLGELDRIDDALTAASEAVDLLDQLTEQAPGKALTRLMTALHCVARFSQRAGNTAMATSARQRLKHLVEQNQHDPRLPRLVAVQSLQFDRLEELRAAAKEAASSGRHDEAKRRLIEGITLAEQTLRMELSPANAGAVGIRLVDLARRLYEAGEAGRAVAALDAVIAAVPSHGPSSTSLMARWVRVHVVNSYASYEELLDAVLGLLRACGDDPNRKATDAIREAGQWVRVLLHRPEADDHRERVIEVLLAVLPLPIDGNVVVEALLGLTVRLTADAWLPDEAGPALTATASTHSDPHIVDLIAGLALKVPIAIRPELFAALASVVDTWTSEVQRQQWRTVAMVAWLRSETLTAANQHREAVAVLVGALPWIEAYRDHDHELYRTVIRSLISGWRRIRQPEQAEHLLAGLPPESRSILSRHPATRASVLACRAAAWRRNENQTGVQLAAQSLAAAYESGEAALIHRGHQDFSDGLWRCDEFDPEAFAHMIAAGVIGAFLAEPFEVGHAGNLLVQQCGWHDIASVSGLTRRVDAVEGVRFGECVVPAATTVGTQNALDAVLAAVVNEKRSALNEVAALRMQWDPYIAGVLRARRGEPGWRNPMRQLLSEYAGTDWEVVAHAYGLFMDGDFDGAVAAGGDGIDQILIFRCRNVLRGTVPIDAALATAAPIAILFRQVLAAMQGHSADDAERNLTSLENAGDWRGLTPRLRALIAGDRSDQLIASAAGADHAVLRMLLDAAPPRGSL